VDPQKRAVCHPVLEYVGSEEPRGWYVIVDFTGRVMICRRVRRSEPFSNVLFYLVPCSRVVPNSGDICSGSRTLYYIYVVRNFVCVLHKFVCVLRNFVYVARNSHIGYRRIWVENGLAA
jgi:hypothetical protein